jgi:predicted lipoprotein with Yx(FWY)xxD motif
LEIVTGKDLTMRITLAAAALAALVAGVGTGQARAEDYGIFTVHDSKLGKVLADPQGMTVYTFAKDPPGKSVCTGECAAKWPPVKAAADAQPVGDFTIITRDDGTRQWADENRPLYTYVKDAKPGDVMGDFVNGVWHVEKEE